MVNFRYHVVSLVAVFLALAAGLLLGSTISRVPVAVVSTPGPVSGLRAQISELTAELDSAGRFSAGVAPFAVAGRLSGQSVAVVSAPGVVGTVRGQVESMLRRAGAVVTTDIVLTSSWLDPNQDTLLGALAARLGGPPGGTSDTGAERAASQLASVLVQRPGARARTATDLPTSLAAYQEGRLLTVSAGGQTAASLAVLLVAAPGPTSSSVSTQDLLSLVEALDVRGSGAVLAGPVSAASDPGVLAAARAGGLATPVTTVDSIEAPPGQVALVLALAGRLAGQIGNYGTGPGSGGPLPPAK
ncbi:MAG TPA: copper transporter [Mycobacteriales bacterium]|nr:copper transporter [Mycobacteriales bacterium]